MNTFKRHTHPMVHQSINPCTQIHINNKVDVNIAQYIDTVNSSQVPLTKLQLMTIGVCELGKDVKLQWSVNFVKDSGERRFVAMARIPHTNSAIFDDQVFTHATSCAKQAHKLNKSTLVGRWANYGDNEYYLELHNA